MKSKLLSNTAGLGGDVEVPVVSTNPEDTIHGHRSGLYTRGTSLDDVSIARDLQQETITSFLNDSVVTNPSTLQCRVCGSVSLKKVLSLGFTPLANDFLISSDVSGQTTYPLDVVFCEGCSLMQITETVDPQVLFKDYLYFSSFSDTMLEHAKRLAETLIDNFDLGKHDLVVELASNDGYLLKNYLKAGIPVLGVEPARNVAEVAISAGIPTVVDFFDARLGLQLAKSRGHAKVIHAHNVLAHVADTNSFVLGIQRLLDRDGVVIVEVPYVRELLSRCAFDTIYHEHLCYFSLASLEQLFLRNGMSIHHIERFDIHGGSLRIFAGHSGRHVKTDAFWALFEEEKAWGVSDPKTYQGFGNNVRSLRAALSSMLRELKQAGKSIAAYGAAAKGSTLLNYINLGPDLIDFVVDRSPYKQGLFMPGVGIPVFPPEKLLSARPDYTLLLTWNFADEILRQQQDYVNAGGRFILPVPYPKIVPTDR